MGREPDPDHVIRSPNGICRKFWHWLTDQIDCLSIVTEIARAAGTGSKPKDLWFPPVIGTTRLWWTYNRRCRCRQSVFSRHPEVDGRQSGWSKSKAVP